MKISCRVYDEETGCHADVELDWDLFLSAVEAVQNKIAEQLREIVKQQKEILGEMYGPYSVWHVNEHYELATIERSGELILAYEEPWQYGDEHTKHVLLLDVLDGSFVTNTVDEARKYKIALERQEKDRKASIERMERQKLQEYLQKYGAP